MYLAGRELLLARAHIGGQIQISAEHLLARQSFLSDQFQQRSLDVNLHHVLESLTRCRDQRSFITTMRLFFEPLYSHGRTTNELLAVRKQRPVSREPRLGPTFHQRPFAIRTAPRLVQCREL